MPEPIPEPRASGQTRSTAIPLHWAIHGSEGAPQLLVLHGGPGAHHDYLLPQMLRLAERYELIFYDQRGGGRSRTDDRSPITWRTHAEDLAAVIDEFGLGSADVVGYSWGGLLALLYAVETFSANLDAPHPARLVLIDPAPLSSTLRRQFEEEFARRQRSPAITALRDELQRSGLRESDPDAYRQRLFEAGVAGYFADPAKAAGLTPFRVTGRVQESVWASLGEFDLIPQLGVVRCPALLIHGTADPIPIESSEAAAAALPDARLVTLEGSGHVPYVESPGPLFSAIFGFLDPSHAERNA
jgi:proline iminopeptidase